MQKTMKMLAIIGILTSVAMIGGGFAYADNSTATAPTPGQTATISIGVNAGAALASGGIGALSGIILTVVTAWNQNMTQTGTAKVSPKEFAILVALGTIVGIVLNIIGLNPTTNSAVSSGVITAITMLVNYSALHITNMTLRPLFNHWITGKGVQTPSGSKTSAGTDTQS